LLWHYITEIEHFMFPYVFNPKDLPNTFIYNFIFPIILPSSNQPQRKLRTPKKLALLHANMSVHLDILFFTTYDMWIESLYISIATFTKNLCSIY
jgi:hypothetical protein